MNEFPRDIKLEDHWFEWKYRQWQSTLERYRQAKDTLDSISYEHTKPIPCKTWTKCFFYGDQPENLAKLWTEIDTYIKEQSNKEGWEYSHTETEEIDVNDDPYDDYEHLTEQYTVYAVVENIEDFKQSEEYVAQETIVKKCYDEVMELKSKIDEKLKGVG